MTNNEMEKSLPAVSIVSPVYMGEQTVEELVRQIRTAVLAAGRTYEVVLVEDGSPDQSWEKIRALCAQYPEVRGVRLSRNFGQHAAITAGLEAARGEYVVVMDCDLQDDPKFIPQLLTEAERGFDIVYTTRGVRRHSWLKVMLSRAWHAMMSTLADEKMVFSRTDVGNFSLLRRKVVNAFLSIKDQHRHYLLLLRWLGFRATYVEAHQRSRGAGKSSYSFRALLRHAWDGVISHSNRLLILSIRVGFLFCALSVVAISYLVTMYFLHGYKEGWASLAVLILFCTGVNLMSAGVMGLYIGKIFDQSKARPLFVTSERLNEPATPRRGI